MALSGRYCKRLRSALGYVPPFERHYRSYYNVTLDNEPIAATPLTKRAPQDWQCYQGVKHTTE